MTLAEKILRGMDEKKQRIDKVANDDTYFNNAKVTAKEMSRLGFKGTMDDKGRGRANYRGVDVDFVVGEENLYINLPELMVKDSPKGLLEATKKYLDEINKIS